MLFNGKQRVKLYNINWMQKQNDHVTRPTLTVAHHNFQEFDDDFGTRPDQHLTFASLFRIVDRFQSIAQHVHTHHLDAVLRGQNS